MKILLDAMGGDHSPKAAVEGAILFANNFPSSQVTLFGDHYAIHSFLTKNSSHPKNVEIVHCAQKIEMNDSPLSAIRKNPEASMLVGLRALKAGEGDAFVSAGNTGALMSGSLLTLGRIPGIHRPALATYMPTSSGGAVMCDVGANPSPKPIYLLQNTLMAVQYTHILLNRPQPSVGLLNIGEEAGKGSHFDRKVHEMLSLVCQNFKGNIEGNDILKGKVDVIITDGFVGNIVLKFGESVFDYFFTMLKKNIGISLLSKIGALLLKSALRSIKRELNYEEYGGAPLLGVNGIVIKSHGHSSAYAIAKALESAQKMVAQNLHQTISERLAAMNSTLAEHPELTENGEMQKK